MAAGRWVAADKLPPYGPRSARNARFRAPGSWLVGQELAPFLPRMRISIRHSVDSDDHRVCRIVSIEEQHRRLLSRRDRARRYPARHRYPGERDVWRPQELNRGGVARRVEPLNDRVLAPRAWRPGVRGGTCSRVRPRPWCRVRAWRLARAWRRVRAGWPRVAHRRRP